MTLSTSAVAVCCASDSRSSLSNRAFSMAMTAWSANDLIRATSLSSKTLGLGLPQTMAPTTLSCRIIGAAMIELYW